MGVANTKIVGLCVVYEILNITKSCFNVLCMRSCVKSFTSVLLLFLLFLSRNVLRLCGLMRCNLDLLGVSTELSSTGLPGLRGVVEVSPKWSAFLT